MNKENLVPFEDVAYCHKSSQEEKYLVKRYRNYDFDDMEKMTSEEIRILRGRIDTGSIWLLLTLHNIADMTDMLKRIYKGQFKTEGKVDYPLYLRLLESTLQYEDYKIVGRSLVGYRTISKQFELKLAEMWQEAKK